jgi:hypothetical protein
MLGNIAKTISQESKDNPEYRDDLNRIGKKLRAADSIADGLSVIADRIGETRTSSRRSGVDDIRRAIANELQSPAPTLQYVEWLCNECLDELAEVGSRIGCGSGISGYDDNRELSPIQPVIIHAVDINDADRRDTQIVHLKTKTLQQVASVINELKTYDMSQGMAGRQIICERLAIDTGRAMLAFEYVDGVDQTKVRELQNTVLKIIELSTQYARPTGGIFNRIGCWFKNRRITSEINSASAVANRLMAVIAIDWNNLNREQ